MKRLPVLLILALAFWTVRVDAAETGSDRPVVARVAMSTVVEALHTRQGTVVPLEEEQLVLLGEGVSITDATRVSDGSLYGQGFVILHLMPGPDGRSVHGYVKMLKVTTIHFAKFERDERDGWPILDLELVRGEMEVRVPEGIVLTVQCGTDTTYRNHGEASYARMTCLDDSFEVHHRDGEVLVVSGGRSFHVSDRATRTFSTTPSPR